MPKTAAAAALQVPTGSVLLLPAKEPQLHFDMLWEQDIPAGKSALANECLCSSSGSGFPSCSTEVLVSWMQPGSADRPLLDVIYRSIYCFV